MKETDRKFINCDTDVYKKGFSVKQLFILSTAFT